MFTIDASKPTLPADYVLLSKEDVQPILDGATEICSSREDNDSEIWSLTSAGQFIRQTGIHEDRFYVVPQADAIVLLADYASDEVLAELRSAGAFDEMIGGPTL